MRARANPDIRLIRTRLGLTQTDMADQIGVRLAAVWNWEHGRPMSRLPRIIFAAWLRQPHIVQRLTEVMTVEEILAAVGEPVSGTHSSVSSPS